MFFVPFPSFDDEKQGTIFTINENQIDDDKAESHEITEIVHISRTVLFMHIDEKVI